MDAETEVRTCARCGATAAGPAGGLPEGWSMTTDRGRLDYQCLPCVRANIRSIEAKLPGEYWEH